MFVSYWDSGFVVLDVTSPANPVFEGRTVYPANADGDAHSSNFDEARQLLFAADEDFCKNSGPKDRDRVRLSPDLRLFEPRPVGPGRLVPPPNSAGLGSQGSGDYSIHNPFVVGTDVYLSWYSDGVRVLDASDPEKPVEVAYLVPPAGQNPVKPPQRGTLSQMPQVWESWSTRPPISSTRAT